MKVCECGCGRETTIAEEVDGRDGIKKGMHRRFIRGHNGRGKNNGSWNGGRFITNNYVSVLMPDHPHARSTGYIFEHILIIEKALGKVLPESAAGHHVDGNGLNNQNNNLVCCQDNSYHKILHQRKKAFEACGHARWRKCPFCKKYADPVDLKKNGISYYHNSCKVNYNRQRRDNHGPHMDY